jgi:hypothetical protein
MIIKYEEIEVESFGTIQKHIIIDNGDGSFKSFPADPENPEYVRFLEALEATEPEAEDN